MFPLELGSEDQFAALRGLLQQAGYTEAAVCQRLTLKNIYDFKIVGNETPLSPEIPDAAALLTRLLLEGGYITEQQMNGFLGPGALEILLGLGLVAPEPPEAERWSATALLYPMRDLYIASDRAHNAGGAEFIWPTDIVYPAIMPNTDLFLSLLPDTPCDAFLDLCCGTGIAALATARMAHQAWAADIAGRCTHFAEFNRRLNGIANVTVAESDVYQAVGGQTFDRIAVHPPYVPVFKPQWIFDSGGEDGEHVTRRVVEGLPAHLRPGGRLYCLAMGSDRDQPFELRLREWLGNEQAEFDVGFFVRKALDPAQYAARSVLARHGSAEEVHAFQEQFRRLDIRSLVYGLIVVQRRETPRATFTARRQRAEAVGRAESEWLMSWETAAACGDIVDRILRSRLTARTNCNLRIRHRLEAGEWTPADCALETDHPFPMEAKVQPAIAQMLARCDGSKTALEHLAELKAEGLMHPDTTADAFAELLKIMISGGFLEIEAHRLPLHPP